jgi:hypothetical protein
MHVICQHVRDGVNVLRLVGFQERGEYFDGLH